MANLRNSVLIGLIALAIGSGIGYYLTPTKVVTVTKVVESKKVDKDVKTRVTKTTNKDGSVTVVTDITDKSHTVEDRVADSKTTREREKKDWLVSGAYLTGLNGKREIVGGVEKRIIGEVYVGVFATSEGRAGLGVTIRF